MFARLTALAQRRSELDALEAEWLEEVADYHRSEEWRAESYGSAAAALGDACRMDAGVAHAHAHVNLARKLEKMPDVAAAFGRGEISARHAAVIANGFTPARAAEMSAVEDKLVGVARTQSPKVLSGVVHRLTDAIDGDGDGGAESEEARYARRRYHGSRSIDDMLNVNALLDPESADIHEAAIKAELERDQRANDDRPMSQRKADALTNLLRRSLDRGEVGTSRAARPHVTYVVHVDSHPDADALVNLMRTDRDHSGHLSAATLGRIMCDCDVSRVVMFGASEVLDVGRTTRTATSAQWKALVVRDRHCQAPGCKQPPDRCEAHHIRHWAPPYYGPTDLDNLQLLCWHHHRERHRHDAQARANERVPRFGEHPSPLRDPHRPRTSSAAPRRQRT
jgi:hypothetical protein